MYCSAITGGSSQTILQERTYLIWSKVLHTVQNLKSFPAAVFLAVKLPKCNSFQLLKLFILDKSTYVP